MRFTGLDFKLLDDELERKKAFAAEFRGSITFPIAQHPEDYAKRPHLKFEENRIICCQDNLGQFSPQQYHLLRSVEASRTGVVHVLELCEPNEELRLAALWNNVPSKDRSEILPAKSTAILQNTGCLGPCPFQMSTTALSCDFCPIRRPNAENILAISEKYSPKILFLAMQECQYYGLPPLLFCRTNPRSAMFLGNDCRSLLASLF